MSPDRKNFIVYKSSAGSGKTFTLVREYLKILLENPDKFRNILAITFTNKAANEMKERVITWLTHLADPDKYSDSPAIRNLLPQLVSETGQLKEQIRIKAGQALSLIIHHYADFSVGTIDSFMHRVVRTFAHDLHIPVNFEVELETDALLEQVISLLISRVGTDEKLTRVLVDFVQKKITDEKSWNIDKELQKFSSVLMKEESTSYLPLLRNLSLDDFREIRISIEKFLRKAENYLSSLAKEGLGMINEKSLPTSAFFFGSKGIIPYLENLAGDEFGKLEPNSYVMKTLNEDEWLSKSATTEQRINIEKLLPQLLSITGKITDWLSEHSSEYYTCRLLLRNLYPIALLNEIEKELLAYNADNDILPISEFTRRIYDIIRKEPAPFIYERLGEIYHHFLLDEFQDTSVMQWQNLVPLVENSLSSGRLNLVVGDGKQSIYRFRSGEVEQLEILPQLMKTGDDPLWSDREAVLKRNFLPEQLDANYRSSHIIVGFNNRFFKVVAGCLPERFRPLYENAGQKIIKDKLPGMVSIEIIKADEDAESDYEDLIIEKIFQVISELEEDNYRWKDIAILCRDNAHASQIASALLNQDINVVSSESIMLCNSSRVNFIVSWMRWLINPKDEVAMATILRFLLMSKKGGISGLDDVLRELKSAGKNKLPAEQNNIDEKFVEIVRDLVPGFKPEHLRRLEIYQLTEILIRLFELNDQADPYLQFFQDKVLDLRSKTQVQTEDFLEWWDDKGKTSSIIVPEGLDAIRIMTIHKAKGLEFPAVIFPYYNSRKNITKDNIWVELNDDSFPSLKAAYLPVGKDMEKTGFAAQSQEEHEKSKLDMVNVLYVAMTRPEERLFVLAPAPPGKIDNPGSFSAFIRLFLESEGRWSAEENKYLFGERYKRSVREKDSAVIERVSLKGYPSSDWTARFILRLNAPEVWDIENPEKNKEWGRLVHHVLSRLQYKGDEEKMLLRAKEEGLLDDKTIGELRDIISQLMIHPDVSRFFDPAWTVRNEPEIIRTSGGVYRPDRVITRSNEAIIIDYKTGEYRESHSDQVRQYAKLLDEMKYHVSGSYLLYINQASVSLREVV